MTISNEQPPTQHSTEEVASIEAYEAAGGIALDSTVRDLGTPFVSQESYNLSPEQMDELEADLFSEIQSQVEGSPIAVAVVPQDSKYADFGRTSEAQVYTGYDNHAAMAPYENQSFFLYTYDTETGSIAHVKRIVRAKTPEELGGSPLTGLEIIDDRLKANNDEHAELDEIKEFHGIDDMSRVWNVAANHIMRRQGKKTGLPYTEASYLALFKLTRDHDVNAILAYVNDDARRSLFEKADLEYKLLGGKSYHLPDDPANHETTTYDTHYVAVCIPETEHNLGVFDAIPLFVPETDAPIVKV